MTDKLDKEIEDFQQNKEDPTDIVMEEALESGFTGKFREVAETYLMSYNKYLKAKAVMEDLKAQSDANEMEMIDLAKTLGVLGSELELTYEGLAKFKIKQSFFGNVTKANKAKVFSFFREQKRENEFFELSVRKAEVNKYVREKIDECKRANKANKGGEEGGEEIKPDLPEGISFGKKHGISLSNRNSDFGI